MWTISDRLKKAILSSSRFKIIVKPNRVFATDLGTEEYQLLSGSLTGNSGNQVPWSGDIEVASRLVDGRNAFSFCDPREGRTIKITYRYLFSDNTYEDIDFPPMLITDLTPSLGKLQLKLASMEQFFADDRSPHFSDPGFLVNVTPGFAMWNCGPRRSFFEFGTSIPVPTLDDTSGVVTLIGVSPRTPDSKKAMDQIDAIGDSYGLAWSVGRAGTFSVRKKKTLSSAVDWSFTSDSSANLLGPAGFTISRSDYYNVVDAGNPDDPLVRGEVTQNSGRFRRDGNFGIRGRYYASTFLTTAPQTLSAAASILATATQDRWALAFDSMPAPFLDPGDVINVYLEGVGTVKRLVDTVTHPLTVGTRSQFTTAAASLPEDA